MKAGLQITADLAKLEKSLKQAEKDLQKLHKSAVQSATGIRQIENASEKSSRSFKKMEKSGRSLGSVLGRVFAVAAVLRFAKALLGASSNLEELDSKARVVFGDSFPKLESRTDKIAAAVGRASSQILQFAADIGAVIQATGLTDDPLNEMSANLAQLSVDLASFHNTSDIQAFNALRSAITGELEPLKRFGVVMTQANLKAYALSQGVDQTIESMNQAQLTTLRYNFILESTQNAQGDAERTASSFANQVRRLQGNWLELNETLGADITSSAANGLSFLNDILLTISVNIDGAIASLKNFANVYGKIVSPLLKVSGISGIVSGVGEGLGIRRKQAEATRNLIASEKALADTAEIQLNQTIEAFNKKFGSSKNISGFGTKSSVASGAKSLQEQLDAAAGIGVSGKSGAGGGNSREKTLKEVERIQREIVKSLGEQASANLDRMRQLREELLLKEEIGELTESEEKILKLINSRTAFQEDVIRDATDAWREQVDALEEVERKITEINGKIVEEREDLESTLDEINKRSDEKRIDAIQDLLSEKAKLDARLKDGEGLSDAEQKRRNALGNTIDSLSADERNLAISRSNETGLERIERERQESISSAEAESSVRVEGLQNELREAEANKSRIVALEQEKSQALLTALADRAQSTFENYRVIEERTVEFVDKQVGQYNRYIAALNSAAAASNSGFGSATASSFPGFANGGPVFGPGGPRDDRIHAKLSRGEFVVNAAATRLYGPMLEKINSLQVPRFASGGPVSNDHSKHASVTVHNHGRAAETYSDPALQKWRTRTMLL